ncbi:MAG TPA: hypothetical protein VJG66_01470 [Patescibacteria group bacterium]|nr:hypothetical protein [Patescibacteria group bacterium]
MSERTQNSKRTLVRAIAGTAGLFVLSHVGFPVRENSNTGSDNAGSSDGRSFSMDDSLTPESGLQSKAGPKRNGLGRLFQGPTLVRAATLNDQRGCEPVINNDNAACEPGPRRGLYELWAVVYQPQLQNGIDNGAYDPYIERVVDRINKDPFTVTSPDIPGYIRRLVTNRDGLAYLREDPTVTRHEIRTNTATNTNLQVLNLEDPLNPGRFIPTPVARVWFENELQGEVLEGLVSMCPEGQQPLLQVFPNGVPAHRFPVGSLQDRPMDFPVAHKLRLIRKATSLRS